MLYLIRHTSVSVPKNICYGQTDVSLSQHFEGELTAVQLLLMGTQFDEIYSSPLKRCMQLAEEIKGDTPIESDKRLMEMNFGNWEMKDWDEIHASEEGKRWFGHYTTAKCPNGESFEEMTARVRDFFYEIEAKLKSGKNIAIATHAGVIRSFMVILEGISAEETFNRKVAYGQVLKYKP